MIKAPPNPADHRLLLLRHGQSSWNAEGRWQGWADPPLSPLGERQAREAARRLGQVAAKFSGAVASDLIRARRTAEILAAELGLGPVGVEPGLRERDVGHWTGLTRAEIAQRWPGDLAAWLAGRLPAIPGGELEETLTARAVSTVTALAGSGTNLLVVSHGGLVRALEQALGLKVVPVGNLAGRWFSTGGGAKGDGPLVPGRRVALADPADRTSSPSA